MLLELLLASAPLAPVKVGSTTLSEMVCVSDVVVVARVRASAPVPVNPLARERLELFGRSLEIGQLEVETWLKGSPTEQPLVVVNQGTWTCDITGASVGERALYFLRREEPESAYQPHLVGYTERFGERPLHNVVHSGRGQMGLRTVAGRELATVWLGDVELPKGAPQEAGPEPEYAFISSLPLEWLKQQVAAEMQAQRALWIEMRANSGAQGDPWVFELRGDRTATLRVATKDGEQRHELELPPSRWWSTHRSVRPFAEHRTSRDFGAAAEGRWAREVLVRGQHGVLTLRADAAPQPREPEFADFDALWSTLEAVLPDAGGMRFAKLAK